MNQDLPSPPGFTILPVADRQTLQHWRDVFVASFETPLAAGQAWVDATLPAGPPRAPWQMYVGYLQGRPVATSLLFNGAGVAGLYAVGVLPAARRQGLGSAISLRPMLDARRQGYRYAVLFSSRLGIPVYRRLGFRPLASQIGIYILEQD